MRLMAPRRFVLASDRTFVDGPAPAIYPLPEAGFELMPAGELTRGRT